MGGKVGLWVGGFFTVEEAVDRFRGGRRDFFSTVIAGLSVAGGFSAWSESREGLRYVGFQVLIAFLPDRFPLITAARTAKVGLISGLAFGLAQDALNLAKGRRLAYVDFVLGRNRSRKALES